MKNLFILTLGILLMSCQEIPEPKIEAKPEIFYATDGTEFKTDHARKLHNSQLRLDSLYKEMDKNLKAIRESQEKSNRKIKDFNEILDEKIKIVKNS